MKPEPLKGKVGVPMMNIGAPIAYARHVKQAVEYLKMKIKIYRKDNPGFAGINLLIDEAFHDVTKEE